MQRRTVTIKWDQLDDFDFDEGDEFFESTNRLSAVVPLDIPLSGLDYDDDGQEFNDGGVSFSNNFAPINSIKKNQNFMVASVAPDSQYDMWMVAPGSITDRRRRLFADMGLNSNKDFARLATQKFSKAYTKRLVSIKPTVDSPDTKIADEKPNAVSLVQESSPPLEESKHVEKKQEESCVTPEIPAPAKPQPESPPKLHSQQPQAEPQPPPPQPVQDHVQSKIPAPFLPVLLVRSRSDGDIDTSPLNTKQRKVELIGSISKKRLTRTSSELVTPSIGLASQYANVVKVFKRGLTKKSLEAKGKIKGNANTATTSSQVDSFFLIKNLKSGKEFVVKETNEGWDKVSDIQTGEQLTMDEYEETVPHSPMVKELNRRTSRKKSGAGRFISSNSLISKSFRISKRKGAAILKTIRSSVLGSSKDEKDKDDSGEQKATGEQQKNSGELKKTSGELKKTSGELKKTSGETKTGGVEENSTGEKKKTSGELKKTSKETKTDGRDENPTGEEKKTSGDQKTSEEKKTGGGEQKRSGELKKKSGDQKSGGEKKTGGGEQTPSREQKTEGGQKKTSGDQKPSTDKNSNSAWVKARAHGKPMKEFSALHLCQEIQAHDGSIWTMRFNSDGRYLATGGEDKVIHVWEVQECDVMSLMRSEDDRWSGTPDNRTPLQEGSATPSSEKKKKSKNSKKKGIPDYAKVPESMFGLSDFPICTLEGHQDDVLDLSWSKSQMLLSSSMDKTVRLWDMKSKNCLKEFKHTDYVTCIHFNPTDDDYFISGSLDTKVRMWSIPNRKVVDWCDVHDMITAICYCPDGQGAIVGLHNGDCKSYCTADCKLEQKDDIELHTKAKVDLKKITGFQFSPLNPSEMLVTSADSRIRIVDGLNVVNKLIGYRNTSSQFLAQYSADGKYIICASEDSQVFIWKHEKPKSSGGAKPKYVTTTSYEHFPCTEVTVVAPWCGCSKLFQRLVNEPQSTQHSKKSGPDPQMSDDNVQAKKSSQLPPVPKNSTEKGTNSTIDDSQQLSHTESIVGICESGRIDGGNSTAQSTAWGMVIVTAGVGGEIKVYQNVGMPVKVGSNLF